MTMKIQPHRIYGKGKFTVILAFLKKKKKKERKKEKISKKPPTKPNNLTCHLKLLEKEQQAKPKVSRKK